VDVFGGQEKSQGKVDGRETAVTIYEGFAQRGQVPQGELIDFRGK